MKLAASFTAVLIASGLGACTTVDLSQVAFEQPKVTEKPAQNVVERASASLTKSFRQKGWSKSGPKEMTNTATRVLLGGLEDRAAVEPKPVILAVSLTQLDADIFAANTQISQTAKAAEVFLTIADDRARLGTELSMLEKALLAAREAETRFEQSLHGFDAEKPNQNLTGLSRSIERLKTITDAYGERIRTQITARASASRS